jgi:3-methyl-2-oxobutanoate hydroxymethyltransferase
MKTAQWTADKIKALKGVGKVVCLTAYDYATARYMDEAGLQLVLVGDSLAQTMLGFATTIPATMEQMLHHTAAVSRGVTRAMVVADMPFMSYQASLEQALTNAGRFIKEAGAGGVKLEGGAFRADTVAALVRNGIPVLGHIGLTPQSIRQTGYKVQGRKDEDAQRLIDDARALEQSGIFALVIECVPKDVGAAITAAVRVPTVGIGAGPGCDGQILVTHDVLGLSGADVPKFVKQYADLGARMAQAFRDYKQDVETGRFPADENCY